MVKKASITNKFKDIKVLEDREIKELNHLNEILGKVIEKADFMMKLEPA